MHVVFRAGPLELNTQNAPTLRRATYVRRLVVPNCTAMDLTIRIAPPFAVQVTATPLFHPVDYNIGDNRYLGAQVGFSFSER